MALTPINGLTLVSVASNGSLLTSVSLPYLAFSPDGTSIAFATMSDPGASLLYPQGSAFQDSNVAENVYDLTLSSGAISAISTNSSNAIGNGPSFSPVFSSNGNFVAFQSYSTIYESVTNTGVAELYLKDLTTKTFAGQQVDWLTEISVTTNGTPANGNCADLVFSADSKMVAFDSTATNLVTTATNGVSQVYTKALDLTPAGIQSAFSGYGGVVATANGTVTMVSSSANGTAANGASIDPIFSPNGTEVAFLSSATNLVPGSTGNLQQLYLKNLVTGAITMVETNGVTPDGATLSAAFSPDGTKLVFSSEATNLGSGSSNGVANVYVYTLATGAISEVSLTANGQQLDGASVLPIFSADGSRVIFQSQATNLVPGGSGQYYDVYIKNLTTGQVGLVSEAAGGARGNGDSGYAVASSNGQYIGFYSEASDLVANDTNNVGDLFVVPVKQAGTPVITLTTSTVSGAAPSTEVLTATLASASATQVSFSYSTADGTAFAGSNYTASSGTLTIPAGATAASVAVPLSSSDALNGSLAFQFVASNPTGGAFDIGASSTEMVGATIILPYELSASAPTVSAGHAVTFTVNTAGVATGTVIDYSVSGIAASRLGSSETGTLTVNASGEATVTFNILINDQVNGATTMTLHLTDSSQASTLATASVIVDDSFTAAGAIAAASQLSTEASILDSVQDISSNLSGLQSLATAGKIAAISLTDSGTPTLSITAAQLSADTAALNDISGNFTVTVAAGASAVSIAGLAGHATTVDFTGNASQHTLAVVNGAVTVTSGGVTDTLSNIAAIQFADVTEIVAATPGPANAVTTGNVTELYSAVLAREPDVGGLTFYQTFLQKNPTTPLQEFAEFFLSSTEYSSAHNYAQSTAGDEQFITDSYQNLLHRTPSTSEVSFYETNVLAPAVANLTPGTTAYASAALQAHALMLVYFSASAEFLGDVQVTATTPASAQHWLVLV